MLFFFLSCVIKKFMTIGSKLCYLPSRVFGLCKVILLVWTRECNYLFTLSEFIQAVFSNLIYSEPKDKIDWQSFVNSFILYCCLSFHFHCWMHFVSGAIQSCLPACLSTYRGRARGGGGSKNIPARINHFKYNRTELIQT